jgi:hypothetical protein
LGDVTPAFIVLQIVLCVGILSVKKEHMIIPIIIAMCFLPADISIKIGGIDFQAIRILALVGIIRIYSGSQYKTVKFNTIDKLFFFVILCGSVVYIIASKNTFGAFIYKCGVCIDSLFLYIVIRYIIQSEENIRLAVKTISVCVIVLLPFTLFEYFSGTNLFSIVGRNAVSIRDGEVRAAGTFSHAILYGSFAAALIPLLWADYKVKKNTTRLVAIAASLSIIYACQSSGPIVALAGGLFFLYFFKWKQYSKILAWSILSSAIFIHFVREMPLWHFLYVRIAVKGSSTGYHRYLLTDAAIKEFWNWWLLGYGDVGAQWHVKYWPYTHARFTDITNQYLIEGVRGGFLTMLLFMILCFKTIKILGSYAISQSDQKAQWLWWGFTVAMITHCISFLSVSYFGQINMLLYLTIAAAAYALDESRKQIPSEVKRRFV